MSAQRVRLDAPTESAHSSAAPTPPPKRTGRLDILRNRALLTLMLGHLTVDMYVGVLPLIYPLLTNKFHLDLKTVGLVSLAYSGFASISQPLFGWIADRFGTRLIGLALFWTAITFASVGFMSNFTVLVILAGLAGIGSGAYHPLGALNANAVIPDSQRNMAMSIYVTGGTVGVAMGPLIGAVIFHVFGVRGTAVMFFPGALIAIWMLFQMKEVSQRLVRPERSNQIKLPPVPVFLLSVVIGYTMLRSWTLFGIQAFIPIWYEELGFHAGFYGPLATVLLLATALGAVGAGIMADRHGRRNVLLVSSVLSVPVIFLFAQFPGWPGFFTAILMGLFFASAGPLLLVIAQELMSGRAGMASALILGLGFVMGAIGIPIMGAIGDAYGIQNAIRFQGLISAITILLAWLVPPEHRIKQLAGKPQEISTS